MELEDARWLWGLLVLPLFVTFAARSGRETGRWRRTVLRRRQGAGRVTAGVLCFCAAVGAVLVAQAGPRVEVQKKVMNRSGIDLCLGIDISKSMLAEDAELPADAGELFPVPNRLNRARYFALDLLHELKGERIGVFVFASQAVELIPFTQDYGYLRYMIRHISDAEIAISGSDLGEAIRTGVAMLDEAQGPALKRLILLTDGEDITADQSTLYEAARLAGGKEIKIDAVGVGSARPVLIPIRSPDARTITDYYLEQDGSPLHTSLDPETLDKVAALSGGTFVRIDREEATPQRLVESILAEARTTEETQGVEPAWLDLAPWFLLAGMGICAAGVFLNN
jgi:Ca-activated chloride channel homolog